MDDQLVFAFDVDVVQTVTRWRPRSGRRQRTRIEFSLSPTNGTFHPGLCETCARHRRLDGTNAISRGLMRFIFSPKLIVADKKKKYYSTENDDQPHCHHHHHHIVETFCAALGWLNGQKVDGISLSLARFLMAYIQGWWPPQSDYSTI